MDSCPEGLKAIVHHLRELFRGSLRVTGVINFAHVVFYRQELSHAKRASYFCLGKSSQNRKRLTRADAAHRSPALLGWRGAAPKLATLRQGRLFGPAILRCSARFKALKIKI